MPGFELIGEEEKQALIEVFDDGGIFFRHGFDDQRNGRYRVIEFEKLFAELTQELKFFCDEKKIALQRPTRVLCEKSFSNLKKGKLTCLSTNERSSTS